MPKVKFDQTYLYKGKYYGPGEADFPDDLEEADKKGLSQGLRDALEGKTTTKTAVAHQSADLSDLTVVELKDKAREAGIEGFSTMNKSELVDALSK